MKDDLLFISTLSSSSEVELHKHTSQEIKTSTTKKPKQIIPQYPSSMSEADYSALYRVQFDRIHCSYVLNLSCLVWCGYLHSFIAQLCIFKSTKIRPLKSSNIAFEIYKILFHALRLSPFHHHNPTKLIA